MDRIDLFVWGLMGTDNSAAQEVEEEEIDVYQGFALGYFAPHCFFAVFLGMSFHMSYKRISQSVLSNNNFYKKSD